MAAGLDEMNEAIRAAVEREVLAHIRSIQPGQAVNVNVQIAWDVPQVVVTSEFVTPEYTDRWSRRDSMTSVVREFGEGELSADGVRRLMASKHNHELLPIGDILVGSNLLYDCWAEPLQVGVHEDGQTRYRQNPLGDLPPVWWWRQVPCSHPQSPVAWLMPDGNHVCHCGELMAQGGVLMFSPIPDVDHPDGTVVTCENCGCHTLVLWC